MIQNYERARTREGPVRPFRKIVAWLACSQESIESRILFSFHVIRLMMRRERPDERPTKQGQRCDKIWKIRADAATTDTIRQFYCVMALVRARITDIFMY